MVSHSLSVSPDTQDLPLFVPQVHQYMLSLCPQLEMLRYPNGPFLPSGLYSMRPSVINLDKPSSPTLILFPLPCFIFLLSISEYMVYIFFFNRLPHWNVSCSVVGLLLSEKAMAPHSSTFAWKIPWTEEPGRLQSMGSQRVRHN